MGITKISPFISKELHKELVSFSHFNFKLNKYAKVAALHFCWEAMFLAILVFGLSPNNIEIAELSGDRAF